MVVSILILLPPSVQYGIGFVIEFVGEAFGAFPYPVTSGMDLSVYGWYQYR
jgi:hypothetical protein